MVDSRGTDRDFVRQHYPESRAEWVAPALLAGETTSAHDGYWSILPVARKPNLESLGIGTGQTREEAWSDAAAKIRARGC